jgi:nucleoid-associated protein YgaU
MRASGPQNAGHLQNEGEIMANLDTLKAKYKAAIDLGKDLGVSWKNVHVENEKLLLRGAAPNAEIKNHVWDAIKKVDADYSDLTADITVDASLPVPERKYTVKSGDTLSKIAKEYYGDASQYMKIFKANGSQLTDPDKIKVGQELVIPR